METRNWWKWGRIRIREIKAGERNRCKGDKSRSLLNIKKLDVNKNFAGLETDKREKQMENWKMWKKTGKKFKWEETRPADKQMREEEAKENMRELEAGRLKLVIKLNDAEED